MPVKLAPYTPVIVDWFPEITTGLGISVVPVVVPAVLPVVLTALT